MSTKQDGQKVFELDQQIEKEIQMIKSQKEVKLPKKTDAIVANYIGKLEGNYDVTRSKMDTDNVVDLLYISYNCTPQSEGEVRVEIADIMDQLIVAQQKSEVTMKNALRISDNITKAIADYFPDWLDLKEENDVKEYKLFFKNDFIHLANNLSQKALTIKEELEQVASVYDKLVEKTATVSAKTEKTLSANLQKKAEVEKEINEQNAKNAELEYLVKDLEDHVKKFDKMAREFQSQAESAENKAFIMGLVKVGADLVSSAIPAVALTKLLSGSPLLSSTHDQSNRGKDKAKKASKQNDAQTKTEIAKLKTSQNKSIENAEGLNEEIKALKKKKDSSAGKEKEKESFDKRIVKKEEDLAKELQLQEEITAKITALEESLKAISQGMKELSEEQRTQAKSLRDFQMDMLNKVEQYENEKSKQTGEMIKIKALLAGKRTEEETIKLTLQSLNLSISALKRAKEIIIEISFFFKSFIDFMNSISEESQVMIQDIERKFGLNETDNDEERKIRKNALNAIIENTDNFFISQTAEWYAVGVVSEKFIHCFNEGWSKLNKLSGKYLTGEELKAYLVKAGKRITEIVEERDATSRRRLNDLNSKKQDLLRMQEGQLN